MLVPYCQLSREHIVLSSNGHIGTPKRCSFILTFELQIILDNYGRFYGVTLVLGFLAP